MYSTDDVELNKCYVNNLINYNLLSEEEMSSIGFRKISYLDKEYYYYCKKLKDGEFSITFNVKLPIPHNSDNLDISVLDEAFGQHYDFQRILRKNPNFKYALEIAEKVEEHMEYLRKAGVITGHIRGDYI